jgi:hypothetical protein
MSIARWGELCGVAEQLRAVIVRDRGELGDRPDLAGDVGGAGHGDQIGRRSSELVRRRLDQLGGGVAERQQPHVVAAPGQHVRVVLDA